MRVNRALNLGCHASIHLSQLELREQIIHGQSVILPRLYNGLELYALNHMIQQV
jgi:hypothetical protein